jgi:hypothetical protein
MGVPTETPPGALAWSCVDPPVGSMASSSRSEKIRRLLRTAVCCPFESSVLVGMSWGSQGPARDWPCWGFLQDPPLGLPDPQSS